MAALRTQSRASLLLGLIAIAVPLLTFSRAAWGQLALTTALLLLLTFVTSRSPNERMRIVLITIAGMVVMALVLHARCLSTERVADLFKERASLDQSYDVGPLGRFGRYVLGAELALDRPFGIGPL